MARPPPFPVLPCVPQVLTMALTIQLHNTLTRRLEPFEPLEPPRVLMYNCGPTVYDFAHIGNFRAFLFADMLRRFLELAGHEVRQVMNITDVGHMTDDAVADGAGEDKMAAAARRLKEAKKAGRLPEGVGEIADPDDPYQVADFYTRAFLEDARLLNLRIADEYDDDPARSAMPRATHYIPHMQRMIQRLLDRGHAYIGPDGAVYFSVESFPDYGRLSGNTLDQLRGGAGGRISAQQQAAKRHPADFLLWKPDPAHIMKWDSPWGAGYPGWHIECSAMATARLGREVIDIHTGGEDNIFPHHECEIAQTCCATGREHFARYWLHTRFLLVEGQKMSKSRGNFFTVRDVLTGRCTGRPVHPAILRLALLRSHYRTNMDFTVKGLQDAAWALDDLRRAERTWVSRGGGEADAGVDLTHPVLKRFSEALADDLNISAALAAVFEWLKQARGKPRVNLAVLRQVDSVLGLLHTPALGDRDQLAQGPLPADQLQARLDAINAARQAKDYTTADALKQELRDMDYDVMDTPTGTEATARPIVTG